MIKYKLTTANDIVHDWSEGLEKPMRFSEDDLLVLRAEIRDALVPSARLTRDDIIGALARAYCHDANARKVLDADLLVAAADEIMELLK